MENMVNVFVTEEEILNKVGLNKDKAVITGVEFNPVEGSISINIRTSEEIKGLTGRAGFPVRRKKLFSEEDKNNHTYNITINTHGCNTKSPQELAEKMINSIKNKGL